MIYFAADRRNKGGPGAIRLWDMIASASDNSACAVSTQAFYRRCSGSSDFRIFKEDLEFLLEAGVFKSKQMKKGTTIVQYWWRPATVEESWTTLSNYLITLAQKRGAANTVV